MFITRRLENVMHERFDPTHEQMLAEGYKPGFPPHKGSFTDIDMNACATSTCPECGLTGLDCEQYYAENSYRAFAVCSRCGYHEEF